MRIRSLLFGPRPNVPAWAVCYFSLFVAGAAGYAQVSAGPQLPTLAVDYVALGGVLLVRALLLAELTRVLLVVYRDGDISRLTKLCTGWAILACGVALATVDLQPGPSSMLLSAVSTGCWWVAHQFITGRLFLFEEMADQAQAQRQAIAAVGARPQPQWLQAIRSELERDPNYRDHH